MLRGGVRCRSGPSALLRCCERDGAWCLDGLRNALAPEPRMAGVSVAQQRRLPSPVAALSSAILRRPAGRERHPDFAQGCAVLVQRASRARCGRPACNQPEALACHRHQSLARKRGGRGGRKMTKKRPQRRDCSVGPHSARLPETPLNSGHSRSSATVPSQALRPRRAAEPPQPAPGDPARWPEPVRNAQQSPSTPQHSCSSAYHLRLSALPLLSWLRAPQSMGELANNGHSSFSSLWTSGKPPPARPGVRALPNCSVGART